MSAFSEGAYVVDGIQISLNELYNISRNFSATTSGVISLVTRAVDVLEVYKVILYFSSCSPEHPGHHGQPEAMQQTS